MAIVVTDNSPVDVLVRMGHADLLPRLFGQVVMPQQVWEELQSPNTPEATRRWLEHPPGWLSIRQPTVVEPISSLHAGEEAAIALAIELGADYLLIDGPVVGPRRPSGISRSSAHWACSVDPHNWAGLTCGRLSSDCRAIFARRRHCWLVFWRSTMNGDEDALLNVG